MGPRETLISASVIYSQIFGTWIGERAGFPPDVSISMTGLDGFGRWVEQSNPVVTDSKECPGSDVMNGAETIIRSALEAVTCDRKVFEESGILGAEGFFKPKAREPFDLVLECGSVYLYFFPSRT